VPDFQTSSDLARSFDTGAAVYRDVTSSLGNHVYERVAESNLRSCTAGRRFRRVLDAGGGIGKWIPFLSHLAQAVDLVDISSESVAVAKRTLADRYPQVSFTAGDLESTVYPSGSFDFVFAQGCVISYTPNPTAMLAEFHRLLEPGGALWLDAYNCLGWAIESPVRDWKLLFVGVDTDHVFRMPDWDYSARMFQPTYLVRLVEMAGFSVESEFGSVILSNSLTFEERDSAGFDPKVAETLCAQEVRLSRDHRSRGAGKNYGVYAIRR